MKLALRTLGGIAGVSTLLLAARLPVLAQDAKPDDTAKPAVAATDSAPVTLTRNYKTDTTFRYKSTMTAMLGGMEVPVKTKLKETIKEIKKNGDIVTEITNEGGTYTLMGEDHAIPAIPPITITEDKYGKVTEYKAEEAGMSLTSPEVTRLMYMANHIHLPTKAVKEKDTWETTLDNPAVKDKKVTLKGTYLGTEKVDGVTLWKIKQTGSPETDDSGSKMEVENTYWVDPADGHAVKTESKLTNIPTQFGNMDAKNIIEYVKPEPKKETAEKVAMGGRAHLCPVGTTF